MTDFINKLKQSSSKFISLVTYFLKHIKISTNYHITLYDFFYIFYTSLKNESITLRASSLTYKIFMSLFPSMIFAFSLIPFFLNKETYQQAVMEIIANIMPYYAFKTFEHLIQDFLFKPKIGFTSVMLILTLFYSVSNMNSLIKTLNKSYYLKENRTIFQRTIASFILTLSFFAILFLSILLISLNSLLVKSMDIYISKWMISVFLHIGRWVIIFFMLVLWFSLLYTIGPPMNLQFRLFNPGSLFSSVFFIIVSVLFNYFILYFSSYNKIYGIAGVMIVFFIWLYYISLIIIIGFEINKTLYFLKVQGKNGSNYHTNSSIT